MLVKRSTAGLLLSVLLPVLIAASAFPLNATAAPLTRPYISSFGAFQNPQSIAVDQTNGDVYVLDVGAKTVSRFSKTFAAKSFSALSTNVIDGSATQPCGATPSANCDQAPFNGFSFSSTIAAAQVAVDNSGSPFTNGRIYVTDPAHSLVDVFAPTGAYVGSFSQTGSSGAAFGEVCGVAVDSSGAVYIGDASKGRIHKFIPTSAVPTNSDFAADFTSAQACQLATGLGSTAGSLFVGRRSGLVNKLSSAGILQYQVASGSNRGVALDPTTGYVLVAFEGQVSELDASGALGPISVGAFGSQQISNAGGIAVDGTQGRAYVSEANGKIYVYGAPTQPSPPTVSLGPYVSPSRFTTGLVGYVDSGGVASTYYFEFGPADCSTSICQRVPGPSGASLGKGAGPVRVTVQVSGLAPATMYHYRLVASNSAGTTAGGDATFTTLDVPTGQNCENSARVSEQLPVALPECRAYELVSAIPNQVRNGLDVLVNSQRVRAAVSGNAFQFTSLTGAADVGGVPWSAEYMAVRGPTSGWSVHGITPSPPRGTTGQLVNGIGEPHYMGDFTAELSKAVYRSDIPLTSEGPNIQEVTNLYRREDLLSPGAGVYRLLSDAATLQSPHPVGLSSGEDEEVPKISGASADLSQVVFESPRNLTADAASLGRGPKLYKWSHGSVRLVGVLPASEGGEPSLSIAGQGAQGYAPHAVSADGSRVLFTAPPFGGVSMGGRLYLRDDHGTEVTSDDTTVKVSASEKTNGAGPGGVDPGGVKFATFWQATPETTRIFFTSVEALTDDAPVGTSLSKLYRYDLNASPGHHLTLLSVDSNPGDGIKSGAEGVIGASEDGSYVYFVGSNQLVAGLPIASVPRIFVWHDGTVEQVGVINGGVEQAMILGSEGWQKGTKWSRVSADGRRLLFVSEGTEELVGYDHGSTCAADASTRCKELYLYTAPGTTGGGRLSCVSCKAGGLAATGDADLSSRVVTSFLVDRRSGDFYLNRPLSEDGGHIFFTSGDRLSPYDENQSPDVYGFDPATGMVSLLSGGRPNIASYFLDAASDGKDVFFATRDRLLPRDGNDSVDVYDARVGGGFEEPAASAPPCESTDACRPSASGSTSESGPGPESARSLPTARRHHRHHKRRANRKKHHRPDVRHRGHNG